MVTTRFAPSPTGHLHVGNLRTALFNCLIARRSGGAFILRLDDTDPERSRQEFVDSIKRDLEWLGLCWDRVEWQSLRLESYRSAAEKLRQAGFLYECFETQGELALRRKALLSAGQPPVYDRAALDLPEAERDRLREQNPGYWRFLLNRGRIDWTDGVQGDVSVDSASLSDPVLIRADGQFLYTLASVVDDLDMRITDVVRGADHVTNTAAQIQIMNRLGEGPPRFAHHSLLTGPQGEPLAKRLGDLAIRDLRANGVEPLAILSLLAFSGSSLPVRLCGSLEEIASLFRLEAFGTSPTKFNEADLVQLTARSLAMRPYDQVSDIVRKIEVPDQIAESFWTATRENINKWDDLRVWWAILRDGAKPEVAEEDREFVAEALALLPNPPFNSQTWETWTKAVSERTGRRGRRLFLPLRMALTGKSQGPEMKQLMPLAQKVVRKF